MDIVVETLGKAVHEGGARCDAAVHEGGARCDAVGVKVRLLGLLRRKVET